MNLIGVLFVTKTLSKVRIQSEDYTYCSNAVEEGIAGLSEGAALHETLDPVANVPNWSVSEYCTRRGRLMEARRFAGMFLDGRGKTMVGRCDLRHETDFGAWEQRLSLTRLWCRNRFSLAVSSDVPFVCPVYKVAYVRHLKRQFQNNAYKLYALYWRYRTGSTEKDWLEWLLFCCFEQPYDRFDLVGDAMEWWRELDFERLQRRNVKERRSVGWHNFKICAIQPREQDSFYQTVRNV